MKYPAVTTLLIVGGLLTLVSMGAGCSSSYSSTLPPSSVSSTNEGEWTQYHDVTHGYTFNYPTNWEKLNQDLVKFADVGFQTPNKSNLLIVTNVLPQEIDSEQFNQSIQDQIPKLQTFPEFKLVEQKDIVTANGLHGKLLAYTTTQKNNKLYQRQYFFYSKNKSFILSFTDSQEEPDANLPAITQIIDSFKIL
jgi:hypothetical protein